MNGLRICIAVGVLASLSGVSVASQGVISFQGAIVEAPCRVPASINGVILQGCAAMAVDPLISARSVEPVRSVRSTDGSPVYIKMIANSENGSTRRQYVLTDRNGKVIKSGHYLMTLAYP